MRKKVISVVTALGLLASSVPTALAATSRYHTTRRDNYGEEYYVDSYSNKVYDNYIIDKDGKKYRRDNYGVSFDQRDNAIIDVEAYQYNNMNNSVNNNWNNNNWNNGFQVNENQELYDYLEYLNRHLNIDIAPQNLDRFMHEHTQTCTDHRCRTGYALYKGYFQNVSNAANNELNIQNNGFNPQYPTSQYPTQEQDYDVLYTLVKTENGKTVYAYSKYKDVSNYGIYGWTCNSIYNENDFNLNSVFYEEINSFGNAIAYNPYISNAINNNTDLYIWNYAINGQQYWCVSPTQDPAFINNQIAPYTNVRFYFVSEYNMNDVNVDLKTSSQVLNNLGFDLIMDVPQTQIQGPVRIYQYQ